MIKLEGVRVHNLKGIDLNIPLYRLIVITGVSGSGKSSLAFNTLYAEGQRRYIESFSAYARKFLDHLEKPDADRIDHIPPAIAIRQGSTKLSARSTVATATEIHDHMRLLFATIGRISCPNCQQEITNDTPATVLQEIQQFPDGTRFQICFPLNVDHDADDRDAFISQLKEDGFRRVIVNCDDRSESSMMSRLQNEAITIDIHDDDCRLQMSSPFAWAVVDRLIAGKTGHERIVDSLELAFRFGNDRCLLLEETTATNESKKNEIIQVDSRNWRRKQFNGRLECDKCGREILTLEPRLFSFNTPLGACPHCRGFGLVPTISFERLVPDPNKTLREGAIAAWTTPAYVHELEELLDLAGDYGVPVDVPFSELQPEHLELITNGVPERDFGGLTGFFRWLERNKSKLPVRVFRNRWRAYNVCRDCGGSRLQPMALAVRIDGCNVAELCQMTIQHALAFFDCLAERQSDQEKQLTRTILSEIRSRLSYLNQVGLDYLTLDRRMKTLSGGEMQRVSLTNALGSNLVNTLYVLDEPSAGLHLRDSERVIAAIQRLKQAGNTVVVEEHEEAFIRSAHQVIDIGPGAGQMGGTLVFQGSPDELAESSDSVTGEYLSGRRKIEVPLSGQRRKTERGWIKLEGASQHTLKNLTVKFPLGVLCVVTGVSGSGKSTLIEDTLYPALCRELRQPCSESSRGEYDRITGVEQIDEVILIDQSPIGRTPRSNAVTYMKVFGEIRKTFAGTPEANLRQFTARHFSFNVKGGGRCLKCYGNGSITVNMQFLADVSMTCTECHGSRYQREILEVKYRGLTIAQVLAMTVGEAFSFFRSQPQVHKRLKFLKDVGLDYLPLGQPATTFSSGESQRLKLASLLALGSQSRTLFLVNEPTIGLHPADINNILSCFDRLLAVGHSVIVIEHNLDIINNADYVVDLGPEAGDAGGDIVVTGTPEKIKEHQRSITGHFLRLLDG